MRAHRVAEINEVVIHGADAAGGSHSGKDGEAKGASSVPSEDKSDRPLSWAYPNTGKPLQVKENRAIQVRRVSVGALQALESCLDSAVSVVIVFTLLGFSPVGVRPRHRRHPSLHHRRCRLQAGEPGLPPTSSCCPPGGFLRKVNSRLRPDRRFSFLLL